MAAGSFARLAPETQPSQPDVVDAHHQYYNCPRSGWIMGYRENEELIDRQPATTRESLVTKQPPLDCL